MNPRHYLKMAGMNLKLKHFGKRFHPAVLCPSQDEAYETADDEEKVKETEVSSVDSVDVDDIKQTRKHVTFVALHIRQHSIVVGDHPCCVQGLPITLDWNIEKEFSLVLDDYERLRGCQRSRDELRLSPEERRELLSNISDHELKRANRKLERERQQYMKTSEMNFFALNE
jgi:predicted Fe-S protein YdhL (DUF1289 family)